MKLGADGLEVRKKTYLGLGPRKMVIYGSGLVDTVVSTLLTWLEDLILKVTGPDFNHKGNQPYSGHLMMANHQSLCSRRCEPAKLCTDNFVWI